MEVVPALIKGWPLPGAWSVVDHSARNASSALRGGPSLWVGVELSVIAMQARTSMHRIAKIVVPGCIATSRCSNVTIVGASPIVEGVRGVMMPTLGLKWSLFTIPRTQRMSLAL